MKIIKASGKLERLISDLRMNDKLFDLHDKDIQLYEINAGMRSSEIVEMMTSMFDSGLDILIITDRQFKYSFYFTYHNENEIAKAVIEILNDE